MKLRKMQTIMIIAGVVLLAGIGGLFVLSLTASRPSGLGVTDGLLAELPASPNGVSTQADDQSHWISPYGFDGAPDAAMNDLVSVVSSMPGATIVEQNETYLYAEFQSSFFRFVDDVEFLIEPETHRIHFRSASRVGYSDMGVNRARMETIRKAFQQQAKRRAEIPKPRPTKLARTTTLIRR